VDKNKVIILVTGFKELEPWNENWKECERTWVPLVRELGYDVKISFGDTSIEDYFLDEGNHIKFKASIGKDGVLDKRLKLPIKWILEHTDYNYYFCIDSDCFVHPKRFDDMINENIEIFSPDYMGFMLPVPGLNVSQKMTYYQNLNDFDITSYASGVGYMISRKVMPQIFPKLIATENWMLECDDLVLGIAMKSENILLLNETSISPESHQKIILSNPHNIPIQYIGDKNSFLTIQHYTNGLMDNILQEIKTETKKIAVLVVYDDKYAEMKKITVDNNIQNYCDLHGYTLIAHKVNDFNRHPAWYKISKSIEILKNEDFDWVFFIDLDCLIMNTTIKLETIIDENYSFIVPSHFSPAIDTPTITPFNTDNVMTGQFLVKKDEMGVKILEDIWESKELPPHMDFYTFDWEQRQTRVTILKPEFKPFVKIIEESLLNRFWYVNSPFMAFGIFNINNNVWKPKDFIVHVSGYKVEDRIKLLSDLNYFSGGAICKFNYESYKLIFSPLEEILLLKLIIKDDKQNILITTQFDNLKPNLRYFIYVPNNPTKIIIEGYDEFDNLISLKLI
jgi:hypothetical protein